MSIRLNSAGRVITKSGKVSCECCSTLISCESTELMRNYWGENLEYAILVPITQQQREQYLTNGAAITQAVSYSPFSIKATRSDGATHDITGGAGPRTVNQTQSTPSCVIQRFYFGNWAINNTFTFSPYLATSYSFNQSDWDGFFQIGFVDSLPDHMMVGFAYWHFINDIGSPFFLNLVVSGTTQEVDRSQFGFGCSSFKPGAIESIWWNTFIAPNQTLTSVPSGANFSVAASVTANSVSVPIQDTPIYYFVHKPSANSIVPLGTWTLNSLSAQLNLSVTIAPLTSPP